jgi:D-threo-aldose 1-dehydrogenase
LEDDSSVQQDGPYVGLPGKRKRCDYSRDGVLRSLEASLQRLGLDRIDIVYIHDLDTACHGRDLPQRFRQAMDGAWPALAELRRQGAIGAIGLGVNEWQVCEQVLQHTDMDCFLLAGRYSLLDQSALASFLPTCQARNVGVVIGGPYNSGILATGPVAGARYDYAPATPAILQRAGELQAICQRHDVPLAAAAIQFPAFHPAVVSVVPGARTVEEMSLNLKLYEQAIPAALWADFKTAGLLAADAPVPV